MVDSETSPLTPADVPVAVAMPVAVATLAPGLTEFAPLDGAGKYEVVGSDMQVLHLKLSPSETILCEPGSMAYMQPDVTSGINVNSCFPRCMSGNYCIMSAYTNSSGSADATIALTPNIPAKVVPLPLGGTEGYFCKRGSYIAEMGTVDLGYEFDCDPQTACCAGQGCVRQTVGGNGTAFLAAMGTIMVKKLEAGETVLVDTYSVVAWSKSTTLGIKLVSDNPCVMCCGGEGLFNTTLTGPGEVYVQSTSIEKVKNALRIAALQKAATGTVPNGAPPGAAEMER